jgi:histidinol-phosphate/aromatic aminotransferase/cobyric acid decarboxylase-like protein
MEKNIYTFAGEHGVKEHRVIDVSTGICPLGPSGKVKAAIRKAVGNLGLRPDPGSAGLGKFFRTKFALAEDSVLFANSLREILYLIPAVCRPRKILIAGPALNIYAEASADSGSEVGHITIGEAPGFETSAESIRRHMEAGDLLFIARPNRITGRLMDKSDLTGIIRNASEKNAFVVVDESLIEFTDDPGLTDEIHNRKNLILLRTTAYYYGLPGLELAYAVASPELTARLRAKRTGYVNMLAAEAAKTAYKDKAYRRLAKEFMEKEKRLFAGALKKMDKVTFYDTQSNVFLVKLDCPEKDVTDALAKAGFLITDCSDIEGLGAYYLRLSVMSHDQNLKLLRILKERCL